MPCLALTLALFSWLPLAFTLFSWLPLAVRRPLRFSPGCRWLCAGFFAFLLAAAGCALAFSLFSWLPLAFLAFVAVLAELLP